MKALAMQDLEEFIPSNEDVKKAEKALKALDPLTKRALSKYDIFLKSPSDQKPLKLSKDFFYFVLEILHQVSHGNAVTIIPSTKEFTTQEAADILNVSRPFFVKLLESGKIPFHKVGAHRRVKASDLMSYKKLVEKQSLEALGELTRMAQEDQLGYDE